MTTVSESVADELRSAFDSAGDIHKKVTAVRDLCTASLGKEPEHETYWQATTFLESVGMVAFAESLLLDWWDHLSEKQLHADAREYRASTALRLMNHYFHRNDRASAFRWALHTQADDLLGGHVDGGGVAKGVLLAHFSLTNEDLEELGRIASKCAEAAHANGWSTPDGFCEHVVLRFLQSERVAHVQSATTSREFSLSPSYLRALMNDLDGTTTTDSGRSFETVALYLASLLPGAAPRRNVLDEDQGFENDVVVRNSSSGVDLQVDTLGRYFLIECKNWGTAIGVSEVGYFLYRMRLTQSRFGLIFSKNGISGDKKSGERCARSLIRRAFSQDGLICATIDKAELESLCESRRSFWSLVLGKAERLRFGRPGTGE